MSHRQAFVSAIKTRFATIITANGYTSNIGARQKEWQTTPVDPADLPCHCLSDPIERLIEGESKNSSSRTFGLEIEVNLLLAEADQTAAKARVAEADVMKAIGKDPTWGGLARRTEPVSSELKLDNEGTRVSGVQMTFRIEYGRKAWPTS